MSDSVEKLRGVVAGPSRKTDWLYPAPIGVDEARAIVAYIDELENDIHRLTLLGFNKRLRRIAEHRRQRIRALECLVSSLTPFQEVYYSLVKVFQEKDRDSDA